MGLAASGAGPWANNEAVSTGSSMANLYMVDSPVNISLYALHPFEDRPRNGSVRRIGRHHLRCVAMILKRGEHGALARLTKLLFERTRKANYIGRIELGHGNEVRQFSVN